MVTSLPPPPKYVDPKLVIESATKAVNRGQKALEAAQEDGDDDMDGTSGSNRSAVKAEAIKLKDDELQWWQNEVQVAAGTRGDTRYGWADVAGIY